MDSLQRMDGVLAELKEHQTRLSSLAEDPEVTADMVMQELSDTVMSFLVDVASLSFGGQLELRQYLHDEVEPAILEGGSGEPEDGLYPEDAELFTDLLLGYRTMLGSALNVEPEGGDEEQTKLARAAMLGQIARIDEAIKRIGDLRIEEDDRDDEDEDEDDGDDADDAAASGDEAPAHLVAQGDDGDGDGADGEEEPE